MDFFARRKTLGVAFAAVLSTAPQARAATPWQGNDWVFDPQIPPALAEITNAWSEGHCDDMKAKLDELSKKLGHGFMDGYEQDTDQQKIARGNILYLFNAVRACTSHLPDRTNPALEQNNAKQWYSNHCMRQGGQWVKCTGTPPAGAQP